MRKLKLFSLLMALCLSLGNVWATLPENPTWEAKALADIPDGSTIIIISNSTMATNIALPAAGAGSGNPPKKACTVSTTDGVTTITPPSGTTLQDLAWTVSKQKSTWKFYVEGSSTNLLYLTGTSSNTALRVGENSSNNEFVMGDAGKLLKLSTAARYVGPYDNNGSDWRTYNSETATNYKGATLTFYVLRAVPTVEADPTSLAFGNVKLNAAVNAKEIAIEGENLKSALTATSSNTDVITVAVKDGDNLTPDGDGNVLASLVVTPITTAYGDLNETITISGGGLDENVVVPVTMHVGGIVTLTNVPDFDFGEIYQGADPTDYKKSFHLHVENLSANKELRVNCAVGFTADPYSPTADENGIVDTDVYVYPASTAETGTLSEKVIDVRCTGNREFADYIVGEMSVTIIDAPSCTLLEKPTLDNENTWASYDNAQLAWNAVTNASQYLVNVTEHEGDPKITNLKTSSLTTSILNTKANTRYDYTIMAVGDGTDYCEEGNPVLEGYFTTADYPAATLTLSENGVERTLLGEHKLYDVVALPTEVETIIPEKTFVGWSTVEIAKTDVKPAYLEPGAEFTFEATSNKLYAVYVSGHGAIDEWQLATSVEAGDIIVFSTHPEYANMRTNGSLGANTYMSMTTSTYNADKSKITSLAEGALQFTIGGDATDGYTLVNNEKYLSMSGDKKISLTDDASIWSISINAGTKIATVSQEYSNSTYTMYCNYGASRFNCYTTKGSNVEVSLYKHVVEAATWNGYTTSGPRQLADPVFTPVGGTYTSAQNITISAAEGTIYYTLDGTDPTDESDEYTAAIVLDTYGEHTIKAIAIDGDNISDVVSATYKIDVPFETVDALLAYVENNAPFDSVIVTGIVSEIVTEYSTEHKNITYNISDDGQTTEGRQLQSFRGKGADAASLKVGDKVTIKGVYTGSYALPELTQNNRILEYTAAAVTSVVISGEANQTTYDAGDSFNFDGLVATANYNTGYTKVVTEEENVWSASPATITTTGNVTVTATYGEQSDNEVIAVTIKTYAVTFSAPKNGTLVVKNGGVAIESGDEFVKGTVLTVVATPAEGYILTNLYAAETDITEDKFFTVGTKAIEVSAVFATKPTAIDNMADGEKAVKIVRNGVIYILRGEKLYNLQGQLVQ